MQKNNQSKESFSEVVGGPVLWLHFILFLYSYPKTGAAVITLPELSDKSGLELKLLKRTLNKLVKYGYITIKQIDRELMRIRLKHHYSTLSIPKGQKYLKSERVYTP